MNSEPTRILIVDDNALIRGPLRSLLEQRPEWVVVAEACNGADAVERFKAAQPHVTLMDFQMPQMNGLEASRRVLSQRKDAAILMLTVHLTNQLVEEARKIGIRGACTKSRIDCVLHAVEAVLKGDTYFAPEHVAA